jgi:hypothetical protein
MERRIQSSDAQIQKSIHHGRDISDVTRVASNYVGLVGITDALKVRF